ncbi:DnaJ family domain-containing protein [Kaarinaea lacus]
MWLIDKIAEQRISEAYQKGEFENLSGAGKPLVLDDDQHVPEGMRVGYRMLKNGGFIPPELQARKEIGNLQQLLSSVESNNVETKSHLTAKLNYLLMKVNLSGGGSVVCQGEYYQKLQRHLKSNE